MLVKKITCDVSDHHLEAFDQAQRQWAPLSKAYGFLGQVGGWYGKGALLFAFWENRETYDAFMNEVHDNIFRHNKQDATYTSISVSLWEGAACPLQWNEILRTTEAISTGASTHATYTIEAQSVNSESITLTFHPHPKGDLLLYHPWTVLPENK